MALVITNNDYNQFVDFASKVSGKTIAQAAATPAGDDFRMEIRASEKKDFIGNIGRNRNAAEANDRVRALFRDTVASLFGGESRIPESVRAAMKFSDYGKGKPLTARRILAVNSAVTEELGKRGFHGTGGEELSKTCLKGSGLEAVDNPWPEMQRRMNRNCSVLMTKFAFDAARPMAGKEITRDIDSPRKDFLVDFRRGFPVTIGGVTYRVPKGASEKAKKKASEDVCNAFVRFVTGDNGAIYQTASPADKRKANLLMKYCSQGFSAFVLTGTGLAFDKNGDLNRFYATPRGQFTVTNNQTKDALGNIQFGYRAHVTGALFNLYDVQGKETTLTMFTDPKAQVDYSLDMVITGNALDKYGNAAWDNLDDATVVDLKDTETQMKEGWIGKLSDGIPEPYRLELSDVAVSFSVHSDNLKPVAP